ncbi:CDP-glycerol glycerophosphotransferase family protein [Pseudocitrobacter cyperus]|uniref:CDP-glycerol glycerophosphotransferase family protein n=1 Tax=Pseudocitrobacter cyperus TaxID=3112843 RepID=A0ABV0HJW4_9ENTR
MRAQTDCVAFFMETSFHYQVYRNIISHLISHNVACELVVNDLIEPAFVNEMISGLRKISMPGLACVSLSSVIKSGKKYRCMISPYYLQYLEKTADIHIRTLYGLAKNQWNHAEWNTQYDYILCYSHYTQASLQCGDKAIVVGNPRFDDWHNKTYQKALPSELNINPAKPTLLYAPTYGDLSSLPHWAEKLGRLRQEYNIIAKLHHGTLYRESERSALKLAQRYLKNIVSDNDLTLTLLEQADYVVTDNSGFIFDAIHADKKVILLNWKEMGKLLADNASYSSPDSPEQKVRAYLPVAEDMQEIRDYLSADWPWGEIAPALQNIKTEYCDAFNDGMAGLRAALVIIEALREQR